MSEIRMVITDLDGTLLQSDHSISPQDTRTLERLGNSGICRVAATGRNLFKVRLVLDESSPFDYVILSSGAGIMDWKTQKMIRSLSIPLETTNELVHFLIKGNYNFKVSRELPDNHNFGWWESYECEELSRYVEHHKKMGDAVSVVPTVNPSHITPLTEGFQAVIWHLLVSHPKLQINPTKWESTK